SDLICRLLAREREGRPASARHVAEAIRRIESELEQARISASIPVATPVEHAAVPPAMSDTALTFSALSDDALARPNTPVLARRRMPRWLWLVPAALLLAVGGLLLLLPGPAVGTVEARGSADVKVILEAAGREVELPADQARPFPPGRYTVRLAGPHASDY